MASPIWKDIYINLGSGTSSPFRITYDGNVIYEGLSVKRPGSANNTIRINDICADYMRSIPPDSGFGIVPITVYSFKVERESSSGSWSTIALVELVNDWSYDYSSFRPAVLSNPVNGLLDPRQTILWSTSQTDTITVSINYAGGGSSKISIPVTITADFNGDFADEGVVVNGGTIAVDLSGYSNVESVDIGSSHYTVAQACHRYVLYYRNIHGGWDSLLFEGTCKRTDALTRHEAQHDYDNRQSTGRGTVNYATEVAREYSLNTGWLNDAQAERMESVLGSTETYLQDLVSGLTWPAVLTGTSIEHKTYDNNGRKLISYAVTLRIAQEMVRR